jgi:hypothetical protein
MKEAKKTKINTEEIKTAESIYDIATEVKKVQRFKPTEGVKFVEFDELGLPKNDGFDYHKYITTDTNTLDNVIDAAPELMELAIRPRGVHIDMDKALNEMNEEGK